MWRNRPGGGVEYEGATVIDGELSVVEAASLQATSNIVVNSRSNLVFGSGSTVVDRIADSIPIDIQGGGLSFAPSVSENRTETLGDVTVKNGMATITVAAGATSVAPELTIDNFSRAPGAVVNFRGAGSLAWDAPIGHRVLLSQPPDLQNGLIGGWAFAMGLDFFDFDFATYDAQRGVRALGSENRPAQVEGAAPQANVLVGEAPLDGLTQDTEVNSLAFGESVAEPTALSLDDHRLTLGSGGLLYAAREPALIEGGELTAGPGSSSAELLVTAVGSNLFRIDSAIVDHSEETPLSLVKSGDETVSLLGRNTYSGPTIVNGEPPAFTNAAGSYADGIGTLAFWRPEAIPEDNSLILNGGEAFLAFETATPVDLGQVIVRQGGSLRSNWEATVVDADEYLLESGVVASELVGEGPILKSGAGVAVLQSQNTSFFGDVTVEDGLLIGNVGRGLLTINGGTFAAFEGSHIHDTVLAGGAIGATSLGDNRNARFIGHMAVTADSELLTYSPDYAGVLPTEVFRGPEARLLIFAGDVSLADGVTLTQIGHGESRMEGRLLVGDSTAISNDNQSIAEAVHAPVADNMDSVYHDTGALRISAQVTADAPSASLNLVGEGPFDLSEASYSVSEGRSLVLLRNGEPVAVNVQGDGNALSGAGLVRNDVVVADGALVSPGDSFGVLAIDGDAALGEGSRFVVEIGGTRRGGQHDALDVSGDVFLDGSLDLTFLGGFTPEPEDGFIVLKAGRIDGAFSNAVDSITVGDVTLPVTYRDRMVVVGNPLVVPEAAAVKLVLLSMAGLVRRRRPG